MIQKTLMDLRRLIEGQTLENALRILAEKFSGRIVFSTSMGLEDQVLTHIIFSNDIPIDVFTLDTGRLFEETYRLLDDTTRRYSKKIKTYFPDHDRVENLVNTKGAFSFYESVEKRKECCFIRKIEPLQRALKNVDCWITGIRAEQSEFRGELPRLEWDESHGLIKFHPLIDWDWNDVRGYVAQHDIPYSSLHDRSFVSIGCAPCTRAVKEGEDFRAGRWWWENEQNKECGLHQSNKEIQAGL